VSRRVGLVGKPLRRRHSKVMHDAAFQAHRIDAQYELCEIEPEALAAFVDRARGPEWLGFQVTAPYKRDVFELLDDVDPDASAIGAVNSVARGDDGSLVGFNTDGPGFVAAVEGELGVDFQDGSVVVAGAGGAARAVVHAALRAGARGVLVTARRAEAATALADEMGTGAAGCGLGDPDIYRALAAADLFVNATTVGMLSAGMAVDPERLGSATAVFDLVYVPPETELLRRARSRGLPAANGAEMLVNQAAIAFRRWTGIEDASPVMRDALEPLLFDEAAP
jgi:shikimate dehydrogenase